MHRAKMIYRTPRTQHLIHLQKGIHRVLGPYTEINPSDFNRLRVGAGLNFFHSNLTSWLVSGRFYDRKTIS